MHYCIIPIDGWIYCRDLQDARALAAIPSATSRSQRRRQSSRGSGARLGAAPATASCGMTAWCAAENRFHHSEWFVDALLFRLSVLGLSWQTTMVCSLSFETGKWAQIAQSPGFVSYRVM